MSGILFFIFASCEPLRIKPKGDKDQSCISLISSSSIGYQLVYNVCESDTSVGRLKGTNGRQKTYEIFHVYCIVYSGFMCQTTVIFGITKDGSLILNT